MARLKKKPTPRRCALCSKPGHNRSTCPTLSSRSHSVPAAPRSVNFFIHHVSQAPTSSPHIIDLKSAGPAWNKIAPVAPEENFNIFNHYHKQPSAPSRATTPKAPAIVTDEFDLPVLNSAPVVQAPKVNFKTATQTKSRAISLGRQKINKIVKTAGAMITNAITSPIKKFRDSCQTILQSKIFWKRSAYALGILTLAVAVPFPARSYYSSLRLTTSIVAENSTEGFMALQDSTAALLKADLGGAEKSISQALGKFETAVSTMQTRHQFLQNLTRIVPVIGQEVKNRQNIVLAGQELALGNTYLIKGIDELNNNASSTLTERVQIITDHLKAALPNYKNARARLQPISADSLPFEYQQPFQEFKNAFASAVTDFENLSKLGGTLQEIFGATGHRRYLLVFQNENEIRPTGGFIGSFALLDVKDGQIQNLDIPAGGSYDLSGQLDTYLDPPAPLLLTNKRWEFQDANWFPDFPASAEKLLWFYRHSRGITADGVIAINSQVLEKLLGIIGPITDDKRNLTLSAENALSDIQNIVENGPEKAENKPKQILSDLAPQFIQSLYRSTPQEILPLLTTLQDSLVQKQIQAYFTDWHAEKTIKEFGWGGQIAPTSPGQDYLMVVNTNIQGQKSDAHIKQTVSHEAQIAADGTITDTVIVTRAHNGSATEALYGATNIDYLRIYVPAGSTLISARGFSWPEEAKFRSPDNWSQKDSWLLINEKEIGIDPKSGTRITAEFNKTAFGNWLITEPGTVSQAVFEYKLPFKMSAGAENNLKLSAWLNGDSPAAGYQLVVQNQSGINEKFDSQIITTPDWKPVWTDGQDVILATNGMKINEQILNSDKIWSVVFTKN